MSLTVLRNLLKKLPLVDQNRECVFVAQDDSGTVCGVIHVELYDVLYFDRMINILGLAVRETHRRQGIAKQLLVAAEKWGKEHDAKFISQVYSF